jgi:hypothetical protein
LRTFKEKNTGLKLAEITDALKNAVAFRQEGKEVVWKLTPQGKLTAQLEELISIGRFDRLHRLADSKGDDNEYDHLLQQIVDVLALIWDYRVPNDGRLMDARRFFFQVAAKPYRPAPRVVSVIRPPARESP